MKSKGCQWRQYKFNGKACSKEYETLTYEKNGRELTEKGSLKFMKKASPCSLSAVKTLTRRTQNRKGVVDTGKRKRICPSSLRKNIEALACSEKILSDDYAHDSACKRFNGCNDLKRSSERSFTTYSHAESSEENDSEDDVCSVGSCSLNNWEQKGFRRCSTKGPCQKRYSLFSDAESCCYSFDKEDNCYEVVKDEAEVSLHDLELHAYRCTLKALYVSGPLSWEQEELLTNLRITLHISNDEHLRELRNLISCGTSK